MLALINRFSKYSIGILGFLAITLSYAQEDRADDISILDVDANGEVDALTDGLLLLRSMFELTDDALVTGVVDSANCKECDAEGIDQYISTVKESTYGKLSANDDQNISGSSLDGTTLTIGIENGNSETVDLSSLEDGVGITSAQASAITANTAKTGITSSQASAITANTAKVGMTLGTTSSTALAGDALSKTQVKIGVRTSRVGFFGASPAAQPSRINSLPDVSIVANDDRSCQSYYCWDDSDRVTHVSSWVHCSIFALHNGDICQLFNWYVVSLQITHHWNGELRWRIHNAVW